jgi:membrane protease YdiL (CAAX protease family)
MVPAAVYPVPFSAEATAMVVLLLATAALPLYVLVFRPIRHQRTWGINEMVAMAVLFLLTLPLAAMMAGIDLPLTLFDLTVVTVAQNALLTGLPAYVALIRYGLPASSLGLRAGGLRRHLGLGVIASALAIPLAIAGEHVAVYLLGLVEGPQQATLRVVAEHMDDPLIPVLEAVAGPTPMIWLFVLLAVIAPIGEEVFFRGFVYGGLRARWGVPVAALVSAGFFAAVHMQLVHGFPIFLLGLLLAVVYERSGSLVPVMVTHGLNNVIAVLSLQRGWGI